MRTVLLLSLALLSMPLLAMPSLSRADTDGLEPYLPAGARASRAAPTPAALTREIAGRSDRLFDAIFTRCAADDVGGIITADFEFHHDQWGLIATSRAGFVETIRKQCLRRAAGKEPASRRERLPGTQAVYPSGESGAIETGVHRFYEIAADGRETLVGIARYSHVWRHEDGAWRVARILSYQHMDVR